MGDWAQAGTTRVEKDKGGESSRGAGGWGTPRRLLSLRKDEVPWAVSTGMGLKGWLRKVKPISKVTQLVTQPGFSLTSF